MNKVTSVVLKAGLLIPLPFITLADIIVCTILWLGEEEFDLEFRGTDTWIRIIKKV